MRDLSIETPTHGRVLIRDGPSASKGLVVGFHGYGESADDMLSQLERVPGSESWTLLSVQALHRFYARGHERVVASWMTRQDRDVAIADNLAYVDRALDVVLGPGIGAPLVFVGFSQGVAMAYRAAILGRHRPRWLVAVGGGVPPEVENASGGEFPSVVIASGDADERYTSEQLNRDERVLESRVPTLEIFRYRGGHEWTDALRDRIREVLDRSA